MEPVSIGVVTALVMKAAESTVGEAGKSAWTALTTLLRRAFTRDHAAQAAVEAVQEGDRAAAQELAGHLVDHAGRDHEFGCELQAWIADTRQTLNIGDNFNIISGGDIGKAIQTRDVRSITM